MSSILNSTVENHLIVCPQIDPLIKVEKAITLFNNDVKHLVIVEQNKPTGLLLQDRLFSKLSTRYGPFLYTQKPVERIMHKHLMTVDKHMTIENLLTLLEKAQYDFGETVIITDKDTYLGLLPMENLFDLLTILQHEHANSQVAAIQERVQETEAVSMVVHNMTQAVSCHEVTGINMIQVTERSEMALAEVMKRIQTINQVTQQQASQLKVMEEKIRMIAPLVADIRKISKQTNLLSINAAIEAVSAGKHGTGFRVIADEVRKLSEEVDHSVVRIESYMNATLEEADNARHTIEKGGRDIQESLTLIQDMKTDFIRLFDSSGSLSTSLIELTADTQQINAEITLLAEHMRTMVDFVQSNLGQLFRIESLKSKNQTGTESTDIYQQIS